MMRIAVNVHLFFQLSVAASLRRFKTATLTGSARLSVAGSATSVGPDTSWWEDSTDIAKPTDRGVQEFYLNVFVSIATNIRNSQHQHFARPPLLPEPAWKQHAFFFVRHPSVQCSALT